MNPALVIHAAQTPLAVKGFRVMKTVKGVDVEVLRYRANELACRQAAADAKWLASRWPDLNYRLEAIEIESDGVLRMDADEPSVPNDETLAAIRVANGEYDVPGI